MKKYLLVLFAAALTLAGCQKHENAFPQGNREVRFTTSLDRYSVKATDTAFENGDQVGIFAGRPINVNNVKASVSGTSLKPDTPIYWDEADNGVVSFYAYYPYAAGATKSYNFSVATNQSSISEYKKSDLMVASAMSAPSENAVALNFKHALSKVVINVDNQMAGVTVSKMEFRNVAASATVDLQTGAVSGVSTDLKSIVVNSNGNAYQLLIVPQTAQPEILVTLSNGGTMLYKMDAAFTFGAGKKATASIVVKEAAAVNFSLSVSDWEDEAKPIDFGEGEELGAVWTVLGLGGDWDNGISMMRTSEEGLETETWEADITYNIGDEFKLRCGDIWAGMKAGWEYYGTGDFEDGYLDATEAAINIVLEGAGKYHLVFTWPSCKFVVTKTGEVDPVDPVDPETVVWKVRGLGNDWSWDAGVVMTCTEAGENPGEGVWECDITVAAGEEFKLCNAGDNGIWAGMKAGWQYYAPGEYESGDNYLDATDAGQNIVIGVWDAEQEMMVAAAGSFHLRFTWPTCWFIITENVAE